MTLVVTTANIYFCKLTPPRKESLKYLFCRYNGSGVFAVNVESPKLEREKNHQAFFCKWRSVI